MTILPISSPNPAPRETLYSYLARLAAVWQTDAPDLAYDMGAPFRRLLNQHEEAFETLAGWAKLTPEVMAELLSWTGVRAGNVRMEFRGELYVSRALRNPVMRGCPVCLREDAAGAKGPAFSAMVMRGDWQFREVTLCIRHRHNLVPLWTATAPLDRYDIAARLHEIEADILSGALDQPTHAPSDYDLWLDRRLEDGSDDTWFKHHTVFVVTAFCRLLGEALLKSEALDDDGVSSRVHAAGFNVAVNGKAAIRVALDQMAAASMGALDEPSKAFGALFTKLSRAYRLEPEFDPFREILRECILDHWPFAGGDILLGQPVPERRFHSLRSAEMEIGIGAKILEHFLVEAGALKANDPRPRSRRLFNAKTFAGLLAEIPTLVGQTEMLNAMGATRTELSSLKKEGLLIPRIQVEKVKNRWRVSDGTTFVAELSAGAISVDSEDPHWETLLLARRRTGVTLQELVKGIRNKQMTVGQLVGVAGFNGIVVQKSEVDLMAAPRKRARNDVRDEVPGTMAAAKFGRSVGLRDGGTFLALIKAGHVPARLVVNPQMGRPQFRMTPDNMASFHQRFVTLTTLSTEIGQHRNTLKAVLASARITPFSPEGQDFGSVYLRDDVMGLIKSDDRFAL